MPQDVRRIEEVFGLMRRSHSSTWTPSAARFLVATGWRSLLLVCCLVAIWPVTALADSAPIPDDGTLPWTDPNHQNPLEVLAGQIASKIANQTVGVRCQGETDWQKLTQERHITAWGYVSTRFQWNGSGWSLVHEGFAQLSPDACLRLQRFAIATSKPTKCAATVTITKTVLQRVTVTKKVRRKVNGRWVTRIVKSTKVVPKKVTEQVQGPARPCYVNGRQLTGMPSDFWTNYYYTAYSINTLAHEAAHLGGDLGAVVPAGYPGAGQVGYADREARAECHGMQWIAYVAEQLGDTADDARAIQRYYFDVVHPRKVAAYPDYGSPDCRENGPLDLSPNDGQWP